MRSLKEDKYYRDRERAAKEFRENSRARHWTNAIRGLRLALLRAEVQREDGAVVPDDKTEAP